MFTGKTKNLGVMGWPIAHSFSPALHNAALAAAGLDYAYIALPVEPAALADAVRGLRSLGFRGVNVTIPHKTAIMEYLDRIDEDARRIGAVNTVVNEGGRLCGYNTDVLGFIDAMKARGFAPAGQQAVVLGAGGAARAVLWGLIKEKVSSISIGVRNVEKARPLAEEFGEFIPMQLFDWQQAEFTQALEQAGLLVNTTPLGMYPKVDAAPPVDWRHVAAKAFVYDIIYTPGQTKFLRQAAENGNPTLNGEGMLAGQGAAAFALWTGQPADINVMKAALRQALAEG